MSYEAFGYFLSLALASALIGYVMVARLPSKLKWLLVLGIALHIFGGSARYLITFFYYGSGDAVGYFGNGVRYAERFLQGDFGMIFNPAEWPRGEFTGILPVRLVSAMVMLFLGPTMVGGYVVFGLFSFLGLLVLGLRVRNVMPEINSSLYLLLLFAWPSLWFWSSSLGKDCLILTGVCLALSGYIGNGSRAQWALLVPGIGLVFLIRPQVAALMLAVMVFAEWLKFEGGWTLGKVVSGVLLFAVGMGVAWIGLRLEGIDPGVDGVQGYLEHSGGKGAGGGGGSNVVAADPTLQGIPLALINILLRPFLWEANNIFVLVSALETTAMWVIAWHRRRAFLRALRNWRQNRLLRFSLPFIFLYSTLLGMASYNLGITVRQRIFVFPFMFAFLAWGLESNSTPSDTRARKQQRQRPRSVPIPQ